MLDSHVYGKPCWTAMFMENHVREKGIPQIVRLVSISRPPIRLTHLDPCAEERPEGWTSLYGFERAGTRASDTAPGATGGELRWFVFFFFWRFVKLAGSPKQSITTKRIRP